MIAWISVGIIVPVTAIITALSTMAAMYCCLYKKKRQFYAQTASPTGDSHIYETMYTDCDDIKRGLHMQPVVVDGKYEL